MGISFKYIENDTILVRKMTGKLKFETLYSSWLDLIMNRSIKPGIIGVVNDIRDAELLMEVADLKKLIELFEEHIDIFGKTKMAVLVSSYKNIVFPMMGDKLTSKLNIKPFSTFDAAVGWIKTK